MAAKKGALESYFKEYIEKVMEKLTSNQKKEENKGYFETLLWNGFENA